MVQPKNASPPRVVTESGMVTDAREVQLRNALPPMVVTAPRLMLARFEHPLKQWLPIFVTPDSTTRDVIASLYAVSLIHGAGLEIV